MSINLTSYLIDLLQRMIEILRDKNDFSFKLLKETTTHKKITIQLDDVLLHLSATNKKNYNADIKPATINQQPHFITTSNTLRNIVDGTCTLDEALTLQKIYIQAPMEDMLGMYRLVVCLLVNGITDFQLRRLWYEFDNNWPKAEQQTMLEPLSKQLPVYGNFIKQIPDKILFINTD